MLQACRADSGKGRLLPNVGEPEREPEQRQRRIFLLMCAPSAWPDEQCAYSARRSLSRGTTMGAVCALRLLVVAFCVALVGTLHISDFYLPLV